MANANTTTISRRAILTGIPAAAIGIGAMSAAAICEATADPIFAAIERHRAAFKSACDVEAALDEEAANIKWDENREAYEALITTVPMTISGIRAAIGWFAEYDEGLLPEESGEFHKTLLKSPALQAA